MGDIGFEYQAGDMLLFNGRSWLSKAIRFIDGADVNHAALAIDGHTMIEAAGNGLRGAEIGPAVKGNNFTLVHRLPDTTDMKSVVEMGQRYLNGGTPYAYQQILLLAFLSITRRLDIKSRILRALVRAACDQAARLLNALMDKKDGTELMICSEFVYRCYDDTNDPRFRLVRHDDWRDLLPLDAAATTSMREWAETQPEPTRPPDVAAAGVGEDPDVVAAEAEAELEPLAAAYLVERGVRDPEVDALMQEVAPMAETAVPDVSDDELLVAMATFRDSAISASAAGDAQTAGIGDTWDRFMETAADFVTPGDLQHMTPTAQVRRIGG
jgi:hypothetical protein